MRLFRRHRRKFYEIAPEEIFLDASNLPAHEESQFEGRLERPVARRAVIGVGVAFLCIAIAYGGRAFQLQVAHGAAYAELSRENTLDSWPLFAPRGELLDRTGVPLAWSIGQDATSTSEATTTPFALRRYIDLPGFAHVLGYVQYPSQDQHGYWWRPTYTPIAGAELEFNTALSGQNGSTMIETNAHGKVVQQNIVTPPTPGQNVTLSINADIQTHLYQMLASKAAANGFRGGAGVIMNVQTGEVIALVSFPEYDEQAFTDGDAQAIHNALSNPDTPLLDRAVAGQYAPGSIVKPIFASAALNEGIISPDKIIDAGAYISVPNPYDPAHPSLFHDWTVHGPIDMRTALAVSSDVYFYTVGGGYGDQPGLGITRLDEYAARFGLGTTTGIDLPGEQPGVIPSPAWKAKLFPNDPTWRLGDTYHTAIGQYGFQVTPIQAVRYAAAIANGGKLMTPQLLASSTPRYTELGIPDSDLEIVREGMRLAVTSTRSDVTVGVLKIPGIDIAAKTGTAQLGTHNQYMNSWTIGFWPYDHPQYAFAAVFEEGAAGTENGSGRALVPFFEWLVASHPEYTQ